ncbi:pyridoxal phosphate-dependent aminotransferase [Weeksellaceae bacterium KMM 9713]|uniref:Aminotransferase n=1 Tax=Profundicola chukchiensis TaxID=2961959 RepID=A0A9X4N233_9FLAO|nr:pyridoxal phosphate-dependent aminotransferase [Profundicola chukchiensis]MDG4945174.1 pyridoxal phosphate-dependent aminotransferase [Profundicola chukchiensis]
MQLSPRLQNLKPSATIAMSVKARELKAEGRDIISLSLGEPDFETPDFIKEAAIQAIKENYNQYTPVGGYLELKEAISKKFKRDNNLDYKPSQIVVSTGAKQSIFNIIQCMVSEGDEVILPSPYWVSYADMVTLAGATVKEFRTGYEQDFKMTPQQLEEAITPKSKILLYSSPCNPSGSVYSREELAEIAKVVAKHPNLLVISDEIYEHITFDQEPVSIASFQEIYDQVATVNGLAKGFAMTGWRIGYMGAPEWLAKACEVFQGQVTSGTNSIAQRAAITAMEADPSEIKYMTEAFHKRRDIVIELAREIEGFDVSVPQGAFYIFPDVSKLFGKTLQGVEINTANDLAMYLLEYANVATVSGESFGSKNCIRLSYAASEKELREAFRRIKEAINNYC